ncbi:hypothetical protein TTHERM_00045010 (macronuclear) [Tetrahymena thermophila SB210]|uniref:Uncharacterized protein n=1 Tax=Tetrahymena thermophila (strain SB210) TaxID=312017 RepID=Q23DU1_TETTS|nr:hypothetical protein TTHERM_00045010 [Tetrahymena thermophila SB210]EAR94341.2 hypothetical protein TTHERM_00045010 [Tetrahymena thermophila SB210]|eukprot:XP_001014595.2 hypothetical protein TTHERM_00045010 [Tetrahymena thermophila SB210]
MLRKKPQIQKKNVQIYQKLEKVIETCGPQVFRFLKPLEIRNLRQVNKLFYYQLMTFEVWNGLIMEIKQQQQQSQISNSKRQLTSINEEEDEKYKAELEIDKKKMEQYELNFQDDIEESDSDEEKKPKKKNVIQRKHIEKSNQQQVIKNTIREKAREQISNIKKDNQSIQEEQEEFEITPQIIKKSSKIQIQQKHRVDLNSNNTSQQINSSQVKLIRRSSLVRDGKYQQANQSINNDTSKTTTISSASSSKREGSSEIRISSNQITQDLEKSSQLLLKKKQQYEQQQIKNGNIFNQKNDSVNNDPLLRTSNSFFKKNFFDRLNQNASQIIQNNSKNQQMPQINKQNEKLLQNSTTQGGFRPQTNILQRRGPEQTQVLNPDQLQWLKVPINIIENIDNLFDIKKSYAQNMKSFEELNQVMDSWIHESKVLEKALDAQSITTETLLQEVTLWSDLCRIIDMFKKECENEKVQKIEKIIAEKCFTDENLKKKAAQFKLIKKNILIDRLSKKNFAQEFQQECFEFFKKLMKASFKDFPDIWFPCLNAIIQLYEKYTVVFDLRIFFVMEKFFTLLLNKMKQCSVSIQQIADMDNQEFVDNLINTFIQFSEQLIEGWKKITDLSYKKESTTKIHEKMFQKKLLYLRSVLSDLTKLKDMLRKLDKQRKILINLKNKSGDDQKKCVELNNQIEKIINYYSSLQLEYEMLDYSNKLLWEETMKQFKQKIEPIRNGIRSLKDDNQKENKNLQDCNKDLNYSLTNKKISSEKEIKQCDEDFINNKSLINNNEENEVRENCQESELQETGFSFYNPMYQTQVRWKID